MSHDDPRYTVGSGNVFADLGLPEPDIEEAKADLALQLVQAIKGRGWTQARAAEALKIDQARISLLMRGRLSGFAADWLMRSLQRLDYDVDIHVTLKPSSRPRAGIYVHGMVNAVEAKGDDQGVIS
jgi:predicted XRE-type DNA-binding protein